MASPGTTTPSLHLGARPKPRGGYESQSETVLMSRTPGNLKHFKEV